MKFEWEIIDENSGVSGEYWWECTLRAKVIGGWIVRHDVNSEVHDNPERAGDFDTFNRSLVFFPDPNHEWIIDSE